MPSDAFVHAAHFTAAGRKVVDLVVIHTMEAPEGLTTARDVARWFAGHRGAAPRASAHYCVDRQDVVQCVSELDVAWHAPGANHNGIGIELAGYARQTPEEWADAYSTEMLKRAAGIVAEICQRWRIPVRRRTAEELRAGQRGLCGHADVSEAFGKSSHWDPGPHFPWNRFLNLLEQRFTGEVLDALEQQ